MNWYIVADAIGQIAQYPAPPAAHVFDVPAVPDVPTDQDVRAATERLIEIESVAAEIPDTIMELTRLKSVMSHGYDASEASESEANTYVDAYVLADDLIAAWLSFQSLVAQQIGHWQSAVAVMEHDIAWQEYEAASGMRSVGRLRPSPAASLVIAEESWIRN